jgi:small subunit ribosomal protein S18
MSEETIQHETPAVAEEVVDAGAMRIPSQKLPRFKKKVCRFCHNKDMVIDYKRVDTLERFVTDRGKILPRRITGTCAKHQRALAREIKRARMIALLPFVEQ